MSAFLNGRPLVGLDQSYRYDRPRVQGVMGLHQSRLHLPLEQGENELRLVVTESFGGGGLIARWVDADGITVVPPARRRGSTARWGRASPSFH